MFKNFPDRQGRTQLVGSRTGTLLWRVQAGTNAGGAAIGLDGTVYQGTTNSTLIAINPDGTVKWTVHVPRAVGSTPALTLDGKVVFVPEDGNVYAVNLDGTPAWHFLTGDTFPSPSGSPAIGPDGTVYTGIDETFYALNQDGSLKWSYSPGGLIGGPPALSRTGRIYVPIDDDLFALDLAGAFLWRYDVQSPYGLSSAPAVAPDGTIYANSVGNTLFALHPDGSLAWRHHTDDFVIDVAVLARSGEGRHHLRRPGTRRVPRPQPGRLGEVEAHHERGHRHPGRGRGGDDLCGDGPGDAVRHQPRRVAEMVVQRRRAVQLRADPSRDRGRSSGLRGKRPGGLRHRRALIRSGGSPEGQESPDGGRR